VGQEHQWPGVVGSGTTYGGYFAASGTGLYASGIPAIQTSGSVGINASPLASLYVQGTTATTTDNTADFYNPSLGPNRSHIHYGTSGHWYIRSAASAGCVIMQDQDPLGWVGIGGTPTTKLTVIGNICASGTIGACSDARFKEHVQTLSGALETVLKLRGVQFNWKTREFPDHHFTEQPQLGFIAQEVNQVLPEVVAQGKDGFYSVDYGRLTPVLVEAVKEQQEQLCAKDAKLAALEKANSEIQKELAAQKELTSRMETRFVRLERVVASLVEKSASAFTLNHER